MKKNIYKFGCCSTIYLLGDSKDDKKSLRGVKKRKLELKVNRIKLQLQKLQLQKK